jgi:hypothetical protein
MSSLTKTHDLYTDLAKALGVAELQPDANGGIQLSVGEDTTVVLFGQNDVDLLVVVPIVALPQEPGYALVSWLLKRNFYDSDLLPFRIACDKNSNLILWGRVELEGQTGERLKGLLNVLATEVARIRVEISGEGE